MLLEMSFAAGIISGLGSILSKKNRHLDIIFQLYQELVIVPTGFRL